MTPSELGARVAIPLLLGALIGLERQWHRRLAGLRTNALVAIGSAGFVIIGALNEPLQLVIRLPADQLDPDATATLPQAIHNYFTSPAARGSGHRRVRQARDAPSDRAASRS